MTARPTQCSIALKDDPTQRQIFESFPDTISESYSASWNPRSPGRANHVLKAWYTGGSYGDFSIDFTIVAGMYTQHDKGSQGNTLQAFMKVGAEQAAVNEASTTEALLQEAENKVRWLQALCFPRPKVRRSADQRGIPWGDPPLVVIALGKFLTIEAVTNRFSVDWSKPFHPQTVQPYAAKVGLTFTRIGTFYPDWYDISSVVQKQGPPRDSKGNLRTAEPGDTTAQLSDPSNFRPQTDSSRGEVPF